jgi:putative glutamine amidotransferase
MNIGIAYDAFKAYFEDKFNQKVRVVDKQDNFKYYDLIIFSGGEDINPSIYGDKNLYSYTNKIRDEIEVEILKKALSFGNKILGICRGHQLINAYLGGKLIQDIEYELNEYHNYEHELTWKNSNISEFFINGVNSLHHQGVIKNGRGLIPTSYYGSVIESTESSNIISVQFHPEFMYDTKKFFEFIKRWSKNV